jgi:hypothetical protein
MASKTKWPSTTKQLSLDGAAVPGRKLLSQIWCDRWSSKVRKTEALPGLWQGKVSICRTARSKALPPRGSPLGGDDFGPVKKLLGKVDGCLHEAVDTVVQLG